MAHDLLLACLEAESPLKSNSGKSISDYHGDIAIVTGTSKLDWDTVEAGKVVDQKTSRSEYLTVLRKEDGHWRIFRHMYQMRE